MELFRGVGLHYVFDVSGASIQATGYDHGCGCGNVTVYDGTFGALKLNQLDDS